MKKRFGQHYAALCIDSGFTKQIMKLVLLSVSLILIEQAWFLTKKEMVCFNQLVNIMLQFSSILWSVMFFQQASFQ